MNLFTSQRRQVYEVRSKVYYLIENFFACPTSPFLTWSGLFTLPNKKFSHESAYQKNNAICNWLPVVWAFLSNNSFFIYLLNQSTKQVSNVLEESLYLQFQLSVWNEKLFKVVNMRVNNEQIRFLLPQKLGCLWLLLSLNFLSH